MTNVKLLFSNSLKTSDPNEHPVLIVGQVKYLSNIGYDVLKVKLEPRVNEEVSLREYITKINIKLSPVVRMNVCMTGTGQSSVADSGGKRPLRSSNPVSATGPPHVHIVCLYLVCCIFRHI